MACGTCTRISKTHEVEVNYEETKKSPRCGGEHFTVSEADVIWSINGYNLFGIKAGDNLECIVQKIARWFQGATQDLEDEVVALRREVKDLSNKVVALTSS
jgi:hypothetical protein